MKKQLVVEFKHSVIIDGDAIRRLKKEVGDNTMDYVVDYAGDIMLMLIDAICSGNKDMFDIFTTDIKYEDVYEESDIWDDE